MLIYEANGGSSCHTEGGDRYRTLISNLGTGNAATHCNAHHRKFGWKFNCLDSQTSPLTSKRNEPVPAGLFLFY